MLPLAAGTLREDSPSLLSKLSEFSLSPPDEEEEQNVQTVDRPAKDSAKTDSAKTYSSDHRRKFHGTNSHSSHNEIYLARILPRGPRVNRDVTRSNFHVSSPSSNHGAGRPTVYFRSPSRRGRTTSTRVFHEIKRNNTIEYQVHDATKQDLLRRLEQGVSEKGLKTELKVMVNMMSQMNILLSKFSDSTIAGTLRLSTKARVVKRVHELAGQMMHYFDRLSKEFERQINDIAEIKAYLPTLGPHVKPTLLRTALKLWDQRIIITTNLASPRPYEQDLFTRLTTFFAVQVNTVFLLKPRYPSKHPLHALTAPLLEHIPRSMTRVCATHATLMRETENLALAMSEARAWLPSVLGAAGCVWMYRQERGFRHTIAKLERKASEAEAAAITVRDAHGPDDHPERRPGRARATPSSYPVISLREYMANTATARRDGAKSKVKGKARAKTDAGVVEAEGQRHRHRQR